MDVQFLRENHDALLDEMGRRGYSPRYIAQFESLLRFVAECGEAVRWEGYEDAYESYCKTIESPHLARIAKSVLAGIERYHHEGVFPGDGRRRTSPSGDARSRLKQPFADLVDRYRELEGRRGAKKPSTIAAEASCAACFLLAMQERGCLDVGQASEPDVLSFFLDCEGRMAKSYTYAKSLRTFFKVLSDNPECARIHAFLPKPRKNKSPLRGLSDGDVAALMSLLRSDAVSLRDRAIGMLFVSYGLRRSDISGLKLSDVSWRASTLSIVQQKTGAAIELPLLPEVGNALYDYIAAERSECDNPYVFQAAARPYGRLSPGGVYGVGVRLLDRAGVERAEGERRGSHVFRHRVATELLGSGEQQP
ncbi:MAG: tyrosine-type recombinase/integrase, partial [Eggerthellaceae bacterium]|nr:tyrosine-type recombinase/integrase [Eggerthellaceae bacterium]